MVTSTQRVARAYDDFVQSIKAVLGMGFPKSSGAIDSTRHRYCLFSIAPRGKVADNGSFLLQSSRL
jgi:hypothetical protein